MRMTNLLAALCIPFIMSCGGSEEPADLTNAEEVAPTLMMTDGAPEPPVHKAMMQQAPLDNRVQKRLLNYCEKELRTIELDMKKEAPGSKYYRFLNTKREALLKRCVE